MSKQTGWRRPARLVLVIRAILFDFNGVLLDDEPLHMELLQELLAEADIELTEADYWATYVGFDDREAFRRAYEAVNRELSEVALIQLIARKAVLYQERIEARGFPFFPGAVDFIAACAESGLRRGVVSGALRSEIVVALERSGASRYFGPIVSADDVSASKPDPEGYVKGIQELNQQKPLPERLLHAHEILAIEDTDAGLEAARAAGLRTIGVEHTFGADRLSAAEVVVPKISDLEVGQLAELLGGR